MNLREKMQTALADPSVGAVDMLATDAAELGVTADADRVVVPRDTVENWLNADLDLD